MAFGYYLADNTVLKQAPKLSHRLFQSGFEHKGITCLSWWSPSLPKQHQIQISDFRETFEFESECPLVFIGPSSSNMKSTVTSISINGDISISTSTGKLYEVKKDDVELCVLSATTSGPLLACSEGGGRVRLYNQDADVQLTGEIDNLNVGRAAKTMTVIKERDTYKLVCGCRDNYIRVYDVPWAVGHCRSSKSTKILENGASFELPPWFGDVGKVHGFNKNIVAMDETRRNVIILHSMTGEIQFAQEFKRDIYDFYLYRETLRIWFVDKSAMHITIKKK
jgi:hypothetical protein